MSESKRSEILELLNRASGGMVDELDRNTNRITAMAERIRKQTQANGEAVSAEQALIGALINEVVALRFATRDHDERLLKLEEHGT